MLKQFPSLRLLAMHRSFNCRRGARRRGPPGRQHFSRHARAPRRLIPGAPHRSEHRRRPDLTLKSLTLRHLPLSTAEEQSLVTRVRQACIAANVAFEEATCAKDDPGVDPTLWTGRYRSRRECAADGRCPVAWLERAVVDGGSGSCGSLGHVDGAGSSTSVGKAGRTLGRLSGSHRWLLTAFGHDQSRCSLGAVGFASVRSQHDCATGAQAQAAKLHCSHAARSPDQRLGFVASSESGGSPRRERERQAKVTALHTRPTTLPRRPQTLATHSPLWSLLHVRKMRNATNPTPRITLA